MHHPTRHPHVAHCARFGCSATPVGTVLSPIAASYCHPHLVEIIDYLLLSPQWQRTALLAVKGIEAVS